MTLDNNTLYILHTQYYVIMTNYNAQPNLSKNVMRVSHNGGLCHPVVMVLRERKRWLLIHIHTEPMISWTTSEYAQSVKWGPGRSGTPANALPSPSSKLHGAMSKVNVCNNQIV